MKYFFIESTYMLLCIIMLYKKLYRNIYIYISIIIHVFQLNYLIESTRNGVKCTLNVYSYLSPYLRFLR